VQVLTNALPGGTIDMDNGNRINAAYFNGAV
jgi:hypothetical protein